MIKSEISNTTLSFSKAEFYTYELIPKNKTKDYLKNFDESASRVEDKKGAISSKYFGRDFTNVVHEWELKDGLVKCWEQIDEFDNFMHWSQYSKPFVKKFQLFLVEIPYFPYDLVLVKAILDEKRVKEITDSNEQLNTIASINYFMKRFPEVIENLGYGEKKRPCYLKFEVDVNEEYVKNHAKEIKILGQTKELNNKNKLKKYYAASKNLRISHFDCKDLDYKMMSIFTKGNSISVLGFLEGYTTNLTYNNYEISFNPKEKMLMWAMHTGFNNEIDYDFSNYVHFVSIGLFLTYALRKLDDREVDFDKLVLEYRNLSTKSLEEKKQLYHKLNEFEEEIYFIKSDLEKIDFVLKNPLTNVMKMILNYNLISPKQYEDGNIFSTGMLEAVFVNNKSGLKQILEKLSDLNKKVLDLQNKFEKDTIFENTISLNKYTKGNVWLSIAILIASGIIAGSIVYDYIIKIH
jgi:hypothetical protein